MSVQNQCKSGPWSVNEVYDKIKTTEWTFFNPEGSGTLWTWGPNSCGELGIGVGSGQVLCAICPVNVPGNDWLCVNSAMDSAMVALKNNGTLWTWGNAYFGRLGIGNTIPRSSPTQIPGTNWCQASGGGAGIGRAFALKTDGTLWAWGNGQDGQLGTNSLIPRSSPTQIPGTAWCKVGFRQALKTDGTLWAWGGGQQGNIGDNTAIPRSSPIQIPGTNWVQTFTERSALKSDGTLWVWGSGGAGGLGDGTTITRSSPIQVPGVWTFAELGTGLKSDGTLWRWGDGSSGTLGDGSTISRSSPVQIPGTWFRASGNNYLAIGLKNDGTLWTWGNNSTIGQLGAGFSAPFCATSPIFVGAGWSKISCFGTAAIKTQ